MRDDFQVPNIGQAPDSYDRSFFSRMVRNVEMTLTTLRARGKVQVTVINYLPIKVASLAVISPLDVGMTAYVSDGRKAGQGAGAGTGVLVFYDGTNWCACDTGQPVSA